jgi:hypothetical protein
MHISICHGMVQGIHSRELCGSFFAAIHSSNAYDAWFTYMIHLYMSDSFSSLLIRSLPINGLGMWP